MNSINKAIIVGNLGRDPEVRTTQSGAKIVNMTVATSDTWTDKSGERQERTEWHRVVIMNDRLADVAERYLKKGSRIYVEEKMQTRKWTDNAGVDKYTTEIVLGRFGAELVLLDRREDAQPRERAQSTSAGPQRSMSDFDYEIPF